MEGLAAPFFIASALLTLAGGAKLARPESTIGALKSIGLPGTRLIAQMLGLVEVGIGSIALIVGGLIPSIAVALSYAGFAGFIVMALRKGGAVSSCGCFGTEDNPPTVGHLVLNVAAAVVGVGAAIGGLGGIPDVISDQPAFGIPFIGFITLGTWLSYLALSILPTLIPREVSP